MTEDTATSVQPAAEPAPSAGRLLAAEREAQGLNLEDVARSLKLAVRQVEAMERDEYGKLPGITFVRGFVRNYARLLQMDPEPLLDSLQGGGGESTQLISTPSERIELAEGQRRPWLWIGLLVLAALIAAPLLVYEALRGHEVPGGGANGTGQAAHHALPAPPKPRLLSAAPATVAAPSAPASAAAPAAGTQVSRAAAAPPAPAPSAASPAPGAAQKGVPVEFSFAKDAWVEVWDKDGKRLLAQLNPAGSKQTVTGEPPYTVVVGNAPNVTVTFRGKPVDLSSHIKGDVARLTLE